MTKRAGVTGTPHYLREYRTLLRTLRRRHGDDEEAALHSAVGGDYEAEGRVQADLVLTAAPAGDFSLLDVGCGSGRAAYALSKEERVNYWGVDILPDLLDYAREKCARSDWRFDAITDIALPASDAWADVILFMSVFTHLKDSEIKRYLAEAARVTKPGGVIIASYLDRDNRAHRDLFQPAPLQRLARFLGRDVMLSFTTATEFGDNLDAAGFSVEKTITYDTPRQHTMVARRRS
ncbi:MAG: class I SAM-dependent methyltransferase [Pseudomonadota bacterium]